MLHPFIVKQFVLVTLIPGFVILQGTAAFAQAKLTVESRVATNGMGPVLTGMTLEEAEAASELKFRVTAGNGACRHVEPTSGIKGVSFIVNEGTIAVAYVSNSQVKTLRGARIGDSEERIRSLYSGQLIPGQSISNRTKALQFVPKDADDRNYRIIFNFAKGRLAYYRSGRLPEVEGLEGCF
jgi:hypothetical protein